MNQKLGMDTIAARGKREALQLQVVELLSITRDLGATHRAASSPSSFGIEPGEKTIAPWSIPSVNAAKVELESARSGALELINRLIGETNAQDLASANDTFDSAKWVRNWATIPRNLLSGGAAFRAILTNPKGSFAMSSGGPFSRTAYDLGGKFLRESAEGARWAVREPFKAASWTKPGDITEKLALKLSSGTKVLSRFETGLGWIGKTKPLLDGATKVLKTGTFVASKGFGVLGAGFGVYNIVEGAKNGDGWQLADGIVGTVTSLGSLAPPPVGVAFAAVGAAYTAGRWLFGEDENGNTGIDKIATGAKEFGNFLGDVVKNDVAFKAAVVDGALNAGKDLLSGKWPW